MQRQTECLTKSVPLVMSESPNTRPTKDWDSLEAGAVNLHIHASIHGHTRPRFIMKELLWSEFLTGPYQSRRDGADGLYVSVDNNNPYMVRTEVYIMMPDKPELCDDLDSTG